MRYSNDLRQKVIHSIKEGKKQTEIAKLLNIDKATIFRWYKRYKETGNTNHLINYLTGRKPKIIDLKILEKLVINKPDSSLHELANELKISVMTVYRNLKKLGFTFKKSHFSTEKEMKKNVWSSAKTSRK